MNNLLQLTIDISLASEGRGVDRRDPVVCVAWRRNHERSGSPRPTLPLSAITHLNSLVRDRTAELRHARHQAEMERRTLGSLLLRTLVPDEESLERLRADVQEWTSRDSGIRLVLVMDNPELENLLWELIYDNESELGYLTLHKGVSIRRAGRPNEKVRPVERAGPLRIFYIRAGHVPGFTSTELHPEPWAATDALAAAIDEKSPSDTGQTTWAETVEALVSLEGQANVFHFTGHGKRGAPGTGELIFPAFGYDSAYVGIKADEIGPVLQQAGIRLAVLAACEVGVDLDWRGFGAALLQHVEAVVSMQAPVQDLAAQRFCKELYIGLGRGWDLERAVAHARFTGHDRPEGWDDWWIPMVHTAQLNSLSFQPHGEIQSRFGSSATLSKPPLHVPDAGDAVPFGPEPNDLWEPPVRSTSGAFVISPNGEWCAEQTETEIRVGRVVDQDFDWSYKLRLPAVRLIAIHGTEYDLRLLVTDGMTTRVISPAETPEGYCDCGSRPANAHFGAWSGSLFTCITSTEHTTLCFSAPQGRLDRDWSPEPSKGATMLDVAIHKSRRTAAWMEGDLLVVSSADLDATPLEESRRTLTLRDVPDRVTVARGPEQLVFVRRGNDLIGWRWTDLAYD